MDDPLKNLTAEDSKTRLILYKGWQQKTDPSEVAKKINKFVKNDLFITSTKVLYYYKRFDKGDIKTLPDDLKINVPWFRQNKNNPSNNSIDSLLQITDDKTLNERCCNREIVIKDGRFCILAYRDENEQSFIVIYDLFLGTKKMNHVCSNVFCWEFGIAGKYLVFIEYIEERDTYRIHTFNIDYKKLNVKQLESMFITPSNAFFGIHVTFTVDQLKDNAKFMLSSSERIMVVEIKNDKIYIENLKESGIMNNIIKTRLVGSKVHGFGAYYNEDDDEILNFCEGDLETYKMKETNVLTDIKWSEYDDEPEFYGTCWSVDNFYGYCKKKNGEDQFLMFNIETLKWTDLKIFIQKTKMMFVDENENLMLYVGNDKERAFYQIALRSPNTLENLSKLQAVRESNVYGNDEYLNAAMKMLNEL